MTPGLVSITFRQLNPREIVDLVVEGGLRSIEWGGDVHVPPGDVPAAREVGAITRDAGLEVAAYGSYFRVIERNGEVPDFEPVLAAAVTLGAPTIRVWAGQLGSGEVDEKGLHALAERLRAICRQADAEGIRIALEYHGGTYTDSASSTLRLLAAADHANLDTLWQPANGLPPEACAADLQVCLPQVSNVHAFHWISFAERFALADGASHWSRYLQLLGTSPRQRHILIEFVKSDTPAQFLADASTLRTWLDEWQTGGA